MGWYTLPGDMFHRLVNLKSLQLGNNNTVSLSMNNPFKYMKGLAFFRLSANKLNTFLENTLSDNIVNGLKTLNLASNPYICDCSLIWFIKWLKNTKIIIKQYPMNYY
jgi:hypothetical protein